MVEILKWLGLLPAADGLLGQVLDVDKMKELDLLRGYLGVFPHALGLVLFFVCRYAAQRRNTSAPTAVTDKRRKSAAIVAAVLFGLCVALWFVSVPDTVPPWIIQGRWTLAAILYLAFYVFLGLSEPEV